MSPESETKADGEPRFSVLRPLRAWGHGMRLVLGSPKQRSLLALLLVQADRPVPRHRMVDGLWGDAPPERAVDVARQDVGAFARLLEPELTRRAHARVLVRAAGGCRLGASDEALGLLRFRNPRDATRTTSAAGRTAAGFPRTVYSHTVFAEVDPEYLRAVHRPQTRTEVDARAVAGRGESRPRSEVVRCHGQIQPARRERGPSPRSASPGFPTASVIKAFAV
ncbi:AfsR/SARP family transcriptional regulator [Streptomyces brasiliscabiei]|uniref:AfsR/SARP family transcriptional regulator n=1 Tax=Streptomyces brasiliscabiei TaxID=2736302 RepID=UPI001C101364|nr:hypothetical protein [Streptomyces brasiliscabiei]